LDYLPLALLCDVLQLTAQTIFLSPGLTFIYCFCHMPLIGKSRIKQLFIIIHAVNWSFADKKY
jgi:hypothetical protein